MVVGGLRLESEGQTGQGGGESRSRSETVGKQPAQDRAARPTPSPGANDPSLTQTPFFITFTCCSRRFRWFWILRHDGFSWPGTRWQH